MHVLLFILYVLCSSIARHKRFQNALSVEAFIEILGKCLAVLFAFKRHIYDSLEIFQLIAGVMPDTLDKPAVYFVGLRKFVDTIGKSNFTVLSTFSCAIIGST